MRVITNIWRGMTVLVCLGLLSGSPGVAAAQGSADQQVQDLNRDAMEAYNGLNIDKAGTTLEEALRIAKAGGVTGPVLAQTHMNLGVVLIGGLADQDAGLGEFVQALCVDPNVQLDPLTSSPDIESVFYVAQQQARGGACRQTGGSAAVVQQPVAIPPDQAFAHQAPAEQTTQTPLPIYAEVNQAARAEQIFLFYKGLGMEQWKRVPMYRYQGGFAYQISCGDVWEPKVSYYIEAHGDGGKVVGTHASAAQPIDVAVLQQRTQGEPALPGAPPPRSCAAEECPPGLEGCTKPGQAAIGDACESNTDCQSGLLCESDVCMLKGASGTAVPSYDDETGEAEDPDDDKPGKFRPFFVQLGLALGMSYVQAGMIADRPPPDKNVFVDPARNWVIDPFGSAGVGQQMYFPDPATDQALVENYPWVPDADSADSLGPLGGSCSADGVETGPMEAAAGGDLLPSRYCVRVKSAGFVPSLALRAAAGYFITPDISAALLMRLQFSAGEGTLSSVLLGARGEYMLTEHVEKGLMVSAFAGVTLGQIQAQPSSDGKTDDAPWVTSGLMGFHVGSTFRYRILPEFGVFMAPELDVQLPTFLMHIDITFAGVEGAF